LYARHLTCSAQHCSCISSAASHRDLQEISGAARGNPEENKKKDQKAVKCPMGKV